MYNPQIYKRPNFIEIFQYWESVYVYQSEVFLKGTSGIISCPRNWLAV